MLQNLPLEVSGIEIRFCQNKLIKQNQTHVLSHFTFHMLKKRNRSIFIKSIHVKSSIFLTKKSVTMKTISEPDMPGDLGGASAYKVVLLRLHQATSKNVPKLIHSRILCVWEKKCNNQSQFFFSFCAVSVHPPKSFLSQFCGAGMACIKQFQGHGFVFSCRRCF